MKKHLALGLITALFLMNLPVALAAVAEPKLDPVKSPVDADKIKVTGTATPNFIITVSGGSANLPPATVNAQGKFEITLYLTQNAKNKFMFYVADPATNEQSKPLELVIEENAAKAKELEKEGVDNIAPPAPVVDEVESPIDAKSITLTGTAEIGSTISVTGDVSASGKTDKAGHFEIKVTLKQNQKNRLFVTATDKAGNLSEWTQLSVEEEGASEELETAEVVAFTDISGHWGEDYIKQLQTDGVIKGYEDNTFRPNNFVNRAELVQMALKAFNYEVEGTVTEKPFTDVELGVWFTASINKAKKEGIVGGYSDGSFHPGNNVTRAEALKILFEAAKIKADVTADTFSDTPADAWFTKYTSFAKTKAISQGYSDGTFKPGKEISRAEVAVMITKMQELQKKMTTEATI